MSQVVSQSVSIASTNPFDDAHAARLSVASFNSSTSSILNPVEARISASFVRDNNLPDGSVLPAGTDFQKSWRVKNDGNCDWPAGTQLVFVGGDRLGTSASGNFTVAGSPRPGDEVDLKVDFTAPSIPGRYTSYWRLRDNEGKIFGHRMWCDIIVLEEQSSKASSEHNPSLSSSAVIMPNATELQATIPTPLVIPGSPTISSVHSEAGAGPVSAAPSEVDIDDIISSSSVSSVMDGDLDSDDGDLWEEAMGQDASGEPDEFVVVYDSSSTDRED
jgi:next-to-BRCA1 protein 1